MKHVWEGLIAFLIGFVFAFGFSRCAHAHNFGQNYGPRYCNYLETIAEQTLYRHYLHPKWTKDHFIAEGKKVFAGKPYQYQDYLEIVNSAFLAPIDKMGPGKEKILSQLKEFGTGAYQECFENQNEPPSE